MIDSYKCQLNADKIYFSVWFIILIIGLIGILISFISNLEQEIQTILIAISTSLIFIGFFLSQIRTNILIEDNDFKIDYSLFTKHFIRVYDIKMITNLNYKKNVKSNFYTSLGQIKVMGTDVIPENWKKYYYHKEIISFNYNGIKVEIGKWKREFNGERLYKIIKNKIK
jgi:hypothetical protein